jgi:biopolymer transport protein ExbD
MPKTTCSNCGKEVQVATERPGVPKRCPACQAVVTGPRSSSERRAPVHHEQEEADAGDAFSKPLPKIDQEELIDMTAMVDIVFFLLIFFLVTSMSTIHSSMPIPTPEGNKEGGGGAQTMNEIEASGDVIIVRINRDDQVEVDGIVIADLSDLPALFQKLRAKNGSQIGLLVIGHSEASHGRAVTVLDAGYEAGMEKVRLAVSDRGGDDAR